jgi:predicted membrane protein
LAAFLASIGFSILFSKHRFCGVYHIHKDDGFDKTINEKDDESVNVDVSFGSTIKYVNTENFKVANLKSSFGSMEVYFDNAKIKEDSAVIKLDVSFSGVEIYLPREWKVINKVDTTLGGIEIKNNSNEKTTKTVTIKGRISFGGVEIHYI